MQLKLVTDDKVGQKKAHEEHFETLEHDLALVAQEPRKHNPWLGQYERRKSVRNEKAIDNITVSTFRQGGQ